MANEIKVTREEIIEIIEELHEYYILKAKNELDKMLKACNQEETDSIYRRHVIAKAQANAVENVKASIGFYLGSIFAEEKERTE